MRNPAWVRDEVILALDLYLRSGRRQLPATHEEIRRLSDVMRRLPFHSPEARASTFRNANGISMILGNFLGVDPERAGTGLGRHNHLQQEVWDEYANDPNRLHQIAQAIVAAIDLADTLLDRDLPEDECFPEGRLLTKLHLVRERSRLVVERKKRTILEATGRLACEVCGFDFEEFYGTPGRGFAECHHVRPLSELPSLIITSLSDLAIVCANCHRILHRIRPHRSPGELRSGIEGARVGGGRRGS